ncbi:tetrapyrrole biosynthesis, uroporphyrinogen III synthase [Aspergillus oleicola]
MPPTPAQILLLKTKSSPHDGYNEFFSAQPYSQPPTFVPVLSHNFHGENLDGIKRLFESGGLLPEQEREGTRRRYGGLIFTSQRAVEAFADLLGDMDASILERSSTSLPLYTVGPATARSLTTLRDTYLPHASIHGAETGNGENLAHYILEHYNSLHAHASHSEDGSGTGTGAEGNNPPLLFLVGETRRDIIPKTLMGPSTPVEKIIGVEEVVVYQTGVVDGFEAEFESILLQQLYPTGSIERVGTRSGVVWVVVFSPTGCDAMVRVLKREMERDEREQGNGKRRVFVATIGPTTRDHLVKVCGFSPDVCAAKPSPEGVGAGIEEFMKGLEESK